ncbi:hypothetical protein [Haloarcula amylovorans]|uniref:hypothetical protein n=1 Tax=Haloarcula amylovorans TaxID=2562280 RepID=UPI001075D86F|nr:hypothetical protein [Halomicroarcula amylolytica]
MDDANRAMRALETLQDIEPDRDHVEVVHEDAVIAVEALVEVLDDEQAAEEEQDIEAPDRWDDDEDWDKALETARKKANVPTGKGTLTTKLIDGRSYYYLQWREGEQIKSQYLGPVEPA